MSRAQLPQDVDNPFVARLHAAGTRYVLAVTGGGSLAISSLLTRPGASQAVLEAAVPYSTAALTAWLGAQPEKFCNEHTARLMAMAAFQRAVAYTGADGSGPALAGIGCTASLASDRPKRGPHRIHVAAQTGAFTAVAALELIKGARSRAEEEQVAAALVLNMVAKACGLDDRLEISLSSDERVIEAETIAPPAWQQLLAGVTHAVLVGAESATSAPVPAEPGQRRPIFPGAFHPLHDGHRAMARVATERLGLPVEWELSITNVDKPPLDFREMQLRAAQFTPDVSLWLSRAPTFVEKAAIFPGATFVVGADTITRIANPHYYGNNSAATAAALAAIAAAGCRFLVFGRKTPTGFANLTSLGLPASLRDICDEVPESAFRQDISSTELRHAEDGE